MATRVNGDMTFKMHKKLNYSWPNPRGFRPLKWHISGGVIRGNSRLQDYWGAGSSLESRFLDIVIGGDPNVEVIKDDNFLNHADQLSAEEMVDVNIDANTRQLFMNYASAFRKSCPPAEANKMLAASYMVMLGKLNYSHRRYPLLADQMKGLRIFLSRRIMQLYQDTSGPGVSCPKDPTLSQLIESCSDFLQQSLETLQRRKETQFGSGPTHWVHSLIRKYRHRDRMFHLRQDFSDQYNLEQRRYESAEHFIRFLNHLPIFVQTVGLTLDSVLKVLTEKSLAAGLKNLSKIWHSGPGIEVSMVESLVTNPGRLKAYLNELRELSFLMPGELAKVHDPQEVKDFNADTIYLSHLIFLRFKVLRNDPNIDIVNRENILDQLESQIVHTILAPDMGHCLNCDEARQVSAIMRQEKLESLNNISLDLFQKLTEILSRPQLQDLQKLEKKELSSLLKALIDSEYKPLSAVLNDEQRGRTHQALVYLRHRLGWELDVIGKNVLTQHLTISDMLRLMQTPKSYRTMTKSYVRPSDPGLSELVIKNEVKIAALTQGIILSAVTPAVALAGALG